MVVGEAVFFAPLGKVHCCNHLREQGRGPITTFYISRSSPLRECMRERGDVPQKGRETRVQRFVLDASMMCILHLHTGGGSSTNNALQIREATQITTCF